MTTRAEVLELASEAEAILPSVAVVLMEYANLLNGGNIVDRPKEAIEGLRKNGWCGQDDWDSVVAYLDWLEGKHVCEWPKELTRERVEELVRSGDRFAIAYALKALAAIAPERKKRVVNLWESKHSKPIAFPVGEAPEVGTWRCVARNIELEE